MPSEYDALLTAEPEKKTGSEYDALLGGTNPEKTATDYSQYFPKTLTTGEEIAAGRKLGQEHPALENAAQALIETGKGFIPHSLNQALGFISPVEQQADLSRKIASGEPINWEEGPIAQVKAAEETPPYSKERFKAGFDVLAQLGMIAGITRGGEAPPKQGLTDTLFPKPTERIPSAIKEGQQPEGLVSSQELSQVGQPTLEPAVSPMLKGVTVGTENEKITTGTVRTIPVSMMNLQGKDVTVSAPLAGKFASSLEALNKPKDDVVHPSLQRPIEDSGTATRTELSFPASILGASSDELAAELTRLPLNARNRAVVLLPAKEIGLEGVSASFAYTLDGGRLVPTGFGAIDLPLSRPGIVPLELLSTDRTNVHATINNIPLQKGIFNAFKTGKIAESNQPEYQGVPPGTNVPENIPEIRQIESQQAGGGGSVEPSAQVPQEVAPQVDPNKPSPVSLNALSRDESGQFTVAKEETNLNHEEASNALKEAKDYDDMYKKLTDCLGKKA